MLGAEGLVPEAARGSFITLPPAVGLLPLLFSFTNAVRLLDWSNFCALSGSSARSLSV